MISLLIVDDEPIVVDSMLLAVNYNSFHIDNVYSANSMSEAQPLMRTNHIDIALCDIEMPGGSGLELIQWINTSYPNTVTIILSAHNEFEFAQRAVSLQCLDYILKPVTADVMSTVLNKAVRAVLDVRTDSHMRAIGEDYAKSFFTEEKPDVIETVHQYIDKHINEDLSVEGMAQMVFISPNHLTRSFKKRYGMTVIDYITDRRLSLAASMITGSGKTITAIADEVGYFDYVYFTKLFKKHFGVTPREYRAQQKL